MKNLIELTPETHNILLDFHYADARNFTGKAVYQNARCFLHKDAEIKFQKAIEQAEKIGLQFVIFDAYRPPEAQFVFWSHTPDPDFLADPFKRGSAHSRGVAIDLSLVDINSQIPLEMGTTFDAFVPESWHANYNVSVEAQKNRLLLVGLMMNAGFDNYSHEWWHYQFFNSYEYPIIEDEVIGVYK